VGGLPPRQGSKQQRRCRSRAPYAPGNALLPQHSVTPCLVSGARDLASGHELPAQGTNRPALFRFTDAVTRRCGDAAGVLAVASEPSAEPEILRRVTGDWGQFRCPLIPVKLSRWNPARRGDGTMYPLGPDACGIGTEGLGRARQLCPTPLVLGRLAGQFRGGGASGSTRSNLLRSSQLP
jgi:hypothetical protein